MVLIIYSITDIYFFAVRRGTWLGSFTGRPEPEEFIGSKNEFEYTSYPLDPLEVLVLNENNEEVVKPVSGMFRGFYMMDNDESGSVERFVDRDYRVEFDFSDRSDVYSVVGKVTLNNHKQIDIFNSFR